MNSGRNIPFYLSARDLDRIEKVIENTPLEKRSEVMNFALLSFLDYCEKCKYRIDAGYHDHLKSMDGRTTRHFKYPEIEPDVRKVAESDDDADGDSEKKTKGKK